MIQKKITIGFIVSILALVGLLYFDSVKTEREEKEEEEKNKLIAFDPAAVNRIDLTAKHDGEPRSIVLSKEGETWNLVEPLQAKADQEQVQNFLKSIQEYKYEKVISSESDQKEQYGFSDPEVSLNLGLEGKTITVMAGEKVPVGYSVYLTINGDPQVFIGSQHFLTFTKKEVSEFRDKQILDLASTDVTAVERSTPETFRLVQNESTWEYEGFDSSTYNISAFVNSLVNMKAISFAEDDLSKITAALRNKPIRYEIRTEQQPTKIRFAEHNDKYYAQIDGQDAIFEISKSDFDTVNSETERFRDKKVLSAKFADINVIQLDGMTFNKDSEGKWRHEDGVSEKIGNFMSELEYAQAERFMRKGTSFGKRIHALTLLKDAEEIAQLDIFKKEDSYAIQSSLRNDLLEVEPALVQPLEDSLQAAKQVE